MIPGEPLPAEGDVELNADRETATLTVANAGRKSHRELDRGALARVQ